MAQAWLRGPVPHACGVAYAVTTSVPPGEQALTTRWADFRRIDWTDSGSIDDESWTFRWQCRADRMVLGLEAASRGDFAIGDLLRKPEFKAFFDEVRGPYLDEKQIDEDLPDDEVWRLMARDIQIEQLDLYDHIHFSRLSFDDFEHEAVGALALPRWARIEDSRPEGDLLLVLTDCRTIEDVETFLRTGRSPRRKRSVLWKYRSRSQRAGPTLGKTKIKKNGAAKTRRSMSKRRR